VFGSGIPADPVALAEYIKMSPVSDFPLDTDCSDRFAKGHGAGSGLCDGPVSVGLCLERGIGISLNFTKAVRDDYMWADQGNPFGQWAYGRVWTRCPKD
jgi:hypothetical protein